MISQTQKWIGFLDNFDCTYFFCFLVLFHKFNQGLFFLFLGAARALTPTMMNNVAKRFNRRMKIKDLGNALNVDEFTIDNAIAAEKEMPDAALRVLDAWREDVSSPTEAFDILRRVLLDLGHSRIVTEILEK